MHLDVHHGIGPPNMELEVGIGMGKGTWEMGIRVLANCKYGVEPWDPEPVFRGL